MAAEPPERLRLRPRGTGKSTWLRQTQQGALWLDLLDPEAQRLHQARPERLRERLDAEPGTGTVVIDEVQKVPALLDVVQAGPALPLSGKQGVQNTSRDSMAACPLEGPVGHLGWS
jgi:hypothetical protein